MSFPCIPVIHTLTLQHRIQENESLSLRPHDGSPLLEREEKASAYLLHYYILSSTYKCNFLGADNKQ